MPKLGQGVRSYENYPIVCYCYLVGVLQPLLACLQRMRTDWLARRVEVRCWGERNLILSSSWQKDEWALHPPEIWNNSSSLRH